MTRRNRRKKGKNAVSPPSQGAETPTTEATISQYFFTFELIKQYPTTRSFIVKQPLKRSFKDSFGELFGGNKKGAYRL
ncbi:MAG: hypothetical protein V1861_05830 [Candidatus Micrarchaeota archaeon]